MSCVDYVGKSATTKDFISHPIFISNIGATDRRPPQGEGFDRWGRHLFQLLFPWHAKSIF
jgi:hypothetical protein